MSCRVIRVAEPGVFIAMAPHYPEWQDKEPYKSVLAGDLNGILSGGYPCADRDRHDDAFRHDDGRICPVVVEWLAATRHPQTNRLFTDMVFQPMLEVLGHLRANGFKTFIVSSAPASARWRVERSVLRGWTSADCGGPDRRQRLGYRFSRFRQYASQRSASRRSRQPSDMSASA
jgi:phosphoglycolate phosphatase-like HAD superfamily hydrolase